MEAGTKLKNFYSRLSAAEKVARNMFDQEMKIGNVMGEDGKLFDYSALASLAQRDLPKAAEEMSKLYISGKLSYQTMQKLFTARHFTEIITLLRQINGDVDSFTNGLAKGIDYSNDMYKAMFNITEQSKLLKNNLKDAFQVSLQEGNKSLTGLMMVINDTFKENNKNATEEVSSTDSAFGNLLVNLGLTTAEVTALAGALTVLKPIAMSAVGTLGAIGTALGVSGGAVAGAIVATLMGLNYVLKQVGDNAYDTKKAISDLFDAMNKSIKNVDVVKGKINTFSASVSELSNGITELNKKDLKKLIDVDLGIWEALENTNKELFSLLENLDKVNDIDPIFKVLQVDPYEEDIARLNKELDSMRLKLEQIRQQGLADLFENLGDFKFSIMLDNRATESQIDVAVSKFYKSAMYKFKEAGNAEEFTKAMTEVGQRLGISQKGTETLLKSFDTTKYKMIIDSEEQLKAKIEKTNTEFENRNNILKDQKKEAENSIDAYVAYVKKYNQEMYRDERKITLSSGVEFQGKEALQYMASDILREDLSKAIKEEEARLKEKQALLKELYTEEGILKEGNKALEQKILNETSQISSSIEGLKKELGSFDKIAEGIIPSELVNEIFGDFIDKIDKGEDTRAVLNQGAMLLKAKAKQYAVSKKYQGGIENEAEISKDILRIEDSRFNLENKKAVAKKNSNKYTLESINFSKQQYELELALEKIGKTKGQQVALEYEYRLKTLKANKEISAQELKDAKSSLAKRTGGVGGNIVQEMLKTDPTDIKRLEELGKKYTALFPKEMEGDAGKQASETQKAIIAYIKAAINDKKIYQDTGVNLANSIDEAIKNISTMNPFEKLYEYSAQYISSYKKKIQEAYSSQKDEVWEAYGLGDMSVDDALLSTYEELQLAKESLLDIDLKQQIIKKLNLEDEKQLAIYVEELEQKYNDIAKQKDAEISKNEQLLKLEQQRLNVYNNIGNVISKIGNVSNSESLSNLGEVFSSFGDVSKFMADSKNDFSFNEIFNPKKMKDEMGNVLNEIDWDAWSANTAKSLESALEHMNMGSSIGNLIGGITGGGQSSTIAGTLAGLGTGLVGSLTSGQSMAIQAGASLIGGMFDSSSSDQAEADRKTKESNKLYNKNTEALQDLADRMSSLSGGVDSLNSSLISAFSKIPTVSNLNNVTDALTSMYNTMNKTRMFDSVAYQVTKTKSSKGFLGIGGGSTSWTETIEVSVQEMLNKYGFKGAIEDMTSDQLRSFSKWLDDFDMGDSDNFSILADAIEDYAESLDTMEKNIEKFFYDATMESFEGISSLDQEELRQQIEDFYKDLGFQIDDAMSAQIDALAEQMSVMVTIMEDVRSDFVSNWREMGTDAGKTFVQSMSPYIDSILTNISQIYYDVYFSDINDQLEEEFKNLSDKLVELKQQGQDLNWDDVADELSSSFGDVLSIINATKDETESFNTILLELQKQALESGLTLSEIFDLGLVTGTQETVIDTFKDALSSSEANSAFTAIGDMVGETIGEALVDKMIDNMMSDKILEMSAQLDKIVSGNLSFDSLAGLASEAMSVGLMMSQESQRLSAIKDLFDWEKDITYQNENNTIEYQTGSSTQSVYNYYLSTNMDVSNLVEADSIERLADELLDIMIEKLKTDKGIDLRK